MNTEEFKHTVLPFNQKLLRFAVHILADLNDAKDVVQEVYLKLWKMRKELTGIQNIEAFAMRMTRNKCLDVLKRHRMYSIEEKKQFKERSDESHTADKKLEIKESVDKIKKLIDELPEQQRMVIVLRDIEQYSYEEMASILNMEINAIRVSLSRARKYIRDHFKKDSNGFETNKSITGQIL